MRERSFRKVSWRRAAAVVCAAAAVAAGALAIEAQTPATSQLPTFRGGVDVVQLDVTVLDKGRKPVRGLTAADFTVLEDGKPASIVSFAPVDIPEPVVPTAAWMRDVAPDVVSNAGDVGRLITIVFDDANTGHNGDYWDPAVTIAGKNIARAVVDGLGPNDRAAVVFTFMGRPQNFTNDRARLLAAIDAYAPKDSPSAGPSLGCTFKGQGQGGCVVATLESVASAFPATPARRKVLVFVSAGKAMPGLSMEGADHRSSSASLDDTVRLFRALQQANVTIYAFNPHGLQVVRSREADEALQSLSEETGGHAIIQTNTPWEAVAGMLEQSRAYYLLAFQSTKRDGRFHRVSVKVSRPDADVLTRSGYVADPRKAPKAARPITPLDAAVSAAFPESAVSIETTAAAFAVPGRREAAVFVATAVRPGASERAAPHVVTVRTSAFDREWRDKATDVQTFQVSSPADAAPGAVHATLALKPGRYELRVAAETGGRAGSVFADLEIPAFVKDALSLSGLVVGAPTDARGFRVVDGLRLPVTPISGRRFTRSAPVSAFFQVHQADKRDAQPVFVRAMILNDRGATVIDETRVLAAETFGPARVADLLYPLPLQGLEAGEYLLSFDVLLGDRCLQRTVRFRVEP